MKHVLPVLFLVACGAPVPETFDDSPAIGTTSAALSAVSDGRATLRPYGGDPGGYDLIVSLAIDDAALRAALPDFDGYETVRAWRPSWNGAWYAFPLEYTKTQNGKDHYYAIGITNQGDDEAIKREGVWIDVLTNAGELKGVVHLRANVSSCSWCP